MNKGATIKTVIIGAVLAFCIAGVWMVSAEQIDSTETAERIIETEQNVPNSEFDAEKVYKEIVIENPVHFGRTVPAWNKYEGIEVTSFDEAINDAENAGSETAEGTADESGNADVIGTHIESEGDSETTEGTEYANEATEYNDAAQEIPVEEYVEEPVEDIPAPEESTFVEESVAEPEPIVEEPVAEEPVVEEPVDDGGWSYYGNCRITFYDAGPCCCGSYAYGPTASGVMPTIGRTVASGEDLPFGTEVMIDGNVYVVEDRGVDSGCFDVFVSTHEEALARGLYYMDVYVRWP